MRPATALLVGLFLATSAVAEPYLAVREGAPCSLCHTNRAGGGKRTRFGSVYALTVLPMFQRGRVPWAAGETQTAAPGRGLADSMLGGFLSVGGDLRFDHVTTFGEETRNTFDIREGNLYVEAALGGAALVLDETMAPGGAESREAYALVRGPGGSWLRAGLLLQPFGLRVWDDDAFTRKVSGSNYASSDLGMEVGFERGRFGVLLAASNGTVGAADNNNAKQVSGIVQLVSRPFRVGASGLANVSPDGSRSGAGGFLGTRLGRVTLLGEVDWFEDRFNKTGQAIHSIVGLAELDLLATRGLNLKLVYEYHDPFLDVEEDQKTRLRALVEWFVSPMVYVSAGYLAQMAPPQDRQGNLDALMGELHVFF